MTDPSSLLTKAQSGDQYALGRLLEMYRPYLSLLAQLDFNRRFQARLDASDLVQETTMLAQRDLDKFRGKTEREFTAWLRRIMANVAASAARYHTRKQRDIALERDMQQCLDNSSLVLEKTIVSDDSSPSQQMKRRDRAVIIAEALGRLPADYREVIILRQFEDMRMPEIAERMGRSEDSVQKLWVRGIVKIRELIGGHEL